MVGIQKEVRTRSERDTDCIIEASKGQDREALQDTLGFPLLESQCPETPKKRDTRLKNEIGMNLPKGPFRTKNAIAMEW